MGRREIKEIMRRNKEKKAISPIIVFLAFLLGVAVAAFAAFWHMRSSKDKKSAKASDRTAGRGGARTERGPEAQKVKPYRPRRRVSAKQIFGRMTAVAAASALVVTGLYLAPYDRMTVSTVQAKEKQSFDGIKQVVEEHDEKDPFIILDIVPGMAVSKDGNFAFSLGTIGYLESGQSPIQKDIFRIFEEKGKEKLYPYSARMDLIGSILGSGMTGITYQEVYGGMEKNPEKNGWSMIFDSYKDEAGNLPAAEDLPADGSYPTGQLPAYVKLMPGGGYSLKSGKQGLFDPHSMASLSADDIYTFAGTEGNYRVVFGGLDTAVSGYLPAEIDSGTIDSLKEKGYSDAAGLYCLGADGFVYCGTIGNPQPVSVPEPEDPTDPEDPNKPEQPDKPAEPDKPDNPDNPDNPDTPENPDTPDNPDDPDTPDNPENPDTPENPDNPDTPENPDTPDNPGNPDTPDNPGNPDNPDNPSGSTDSPAGTETPAEPEQQNETMSVLRMPGRMAGWHLYVDTVITEPADQAETDRPTDPAPSADAADPAASADAAEEPADPSSSTDSQDPAPADPETAETTVDPTIYYVLKFTYVDYSETEEQAGELYQILSAEKIPAGEDIPDDSYVRKSNYLRNSLNAAGEAESTLDVDGSFVFVGEGKGEYQITAAGEAEDAAAMTDAPLQEIAIQGTVLRGIGLTDTDEQEVSETAARLTSEGPYYIEVLNAPVYIKCVSTDGRKDWLRRYVFNSLKAQDNASDSFAIEVKTVFPGEVTPEMVQEADLVYLEDGAGLNFDKDKVDLKYIKADTSNGQGDASDEGQGDNDDDQLKDIDRDAIQSLLYGAVEELKPVIVDYGIIENQNRYKDQGEYAYANTDYQKLAMIFLKKDLAAFYREMEESKDPVGSILINAEKESTDYPNKKDNNFHYVNRNVYFVNGSPLVEEFPEPMKKNEAAAGFSEVLAAIRAENDLSSKEDKIPEKVSKAMAVQYIINYSLGLVGEYKDLTILELQPTANIEPDLYADEDRDKKRVVLVWKDEQTKEGQQIFRSSKLIKTNIVRSSVAAFNTSHQDINTDYNMIFIGLDGQRLYRKWDKDGKLSAEYNDETLNGKVYHTGDSVAGADARYDANDITKEKKAALLEYLQAGYPIVVENDCFKGKSARKAEEKDINTKYIDNETQMYAFLKEAIAMLRSDQNEEGRESGIGLYTIEDVHSSTMFAMQLNTVRPKIELWEEKENPGENGGNNSGEAQEPSDMIETVSVPEKPGVTRGTFDYRIASDRTGEDKTYRGNLERHLYLDLNYDGVYAPEEELFEYQHEDAENGGRISIDFNEVNFGIVPWKLEVRDTDYQYRRASMQGCFTISGSETAKIRLLQVLDDTAIVSANLQEQYKQYNKNDKNYMLAYYLKRAETNLKMEWKIETVTPNVLEERLSKNANYLSLWDVVVMGFGESGNPGDAVTRAVNDYITAGGSVLVSSSGASADKGRLGLTAEVLGQADGLTYGKLGLNSDSKYRYKEISRNMFEKTPGLYLDRINDGAVARWPYQIDMSTQLGSDTRVSMADYLLDIGGTDNTEEEKMMWQPYTTAWFTLSDSDKYGAYSSSPRDGRNNYYVYSKGNVVYVGQSQYPYMYEAQSDDEQDGIIVREPEGEGRDECMIFVNALMAAYNGGVHRANVSIVAGFNGVNKIESVTVPFDVAFKDGMDAYGGILGESVDVYFRFTDNNISVGKTTDLAFYYKNDGVSEEAELLLPNGGINTADFTEFTDKTPIWAVEDHRLTVVTGDIVPGKVYRIKAPLLAMQQGEDPTSQICVLLKNSYTNRYTKTGQTMETLSMDSVSLNRAQMFLLE